MKPDLDYLGDLVQAHSTVLVTGPTGCGKSTQVPAYLLRRFSNSKIILTQPRRLAVTSLLNYISQQQDLELRKDISFIMGRRNFDSPLSRFLIATTGSAINILLGRPAYYDYIILDEIHEMNSDILQMLVICSEIQAAFGAKVILMSATVDQSVLDGFQDSCVFEMGCGVNSGFKVLEVPMEGKIVAIKNFEDKLVNGFSDYREIIANAAEQVYLLLSGQFTVQLDQGDILVFVPGISDFNQFESQLRQKMELWPQIMYKLHFLHSKFSSEQKSCNITSDPLCRNVLVSTNICETSLTLPTVTYVVDSCLTKQRAGGKIDDRLGVYAASNEALIQRAGRIGRCKNGCYIPCFSKQQLAMVPPHYQRQDIVQNLPNLIIQLLAQANSGASLQLDHVIERYAMKLDKNDIQQAIQSMMLSRTIISDESGIHLPRAVLQYGGSDMKLASCQLDMFELVVMLLGEQQPELGIFVDPFEMRLNDELYCKSLDSPSIVKFYAYMDNDASHLRFTDAAPLCQPDICDSIFAQMMYLQMVSGDYNGYSDAYAVCKIVALWRAYFPLATEDPTEEEVLWCRQRQLNYESLREFELNTISGVISGYSQGYCRNVTPLEQNMLRRIYPLTCKELEAYFEQIGYAHKEINKPQYHMLAYKSALVHFGFASDYCVTRLLALEKDTGVSQITAVLTSVLVAFNATATFLVDPRLSSTYKKPISQKRQLPCSDIEFPPVPNLKNGEVKEVFDKKILPESTHKDVRFVQSRAGLSMSFACGCQQAMRILVALSASKQSVLSRGNSSNFQNKILKTVNEMYSLPPPLLPSVLSMNEITLPSDEELNSELQAVEQPSEAGKSLFVQPSESGSGAVPRSQNPRAAARKGDLNPYKYGAVFLPTRPLEMAQTQPYLHFDNFAVMSYTTMGNNAQRHIFCQQGFSAYVCSFVMASDGAFSYRVQNGRLLSYKLYLRQKPFYSSEDLDDIDQAVLLSLHYLAVRWSKALSVNADPRQFCSPGLFEKVAFSQAAIACFEQYKRQAEGDEGDSKPLRAAFIQFIRAFGGIQDSKQIAGCYMLQDAFELPGSAAVETIIPTYIME